MSPAQIERPEYLPIVITTILLSVTLKEIHQLGCSHTSNSSKVEITESSTTNTIWTIAGLALAGAILWTEIVAQATSSMTDGMPILAPVVVEVVSMVAIGSRLRMCTTSGTSSHIIIDQRVVGVKTRVRLRWTTTRTRIHIGTETTDVAKVARRQASVTSTR